MRTGGVTLVLGNDEAIRDNVPVSVLSEKFDFIKDLVEERGASEPRISLPQVSVRGFDLAVQFFICGDVGLGNKTTNEERVSSILELIDAAIELDALEVWFLIHKVVVKLKAILTGDYLALKSSHIREAYNLRDYGVDVQNLFVSVAALRFLIDQDDDSDGDDEKDEIIEMSAARQAAYSGSGFVFHREMRDIHDFERSVWKAARNCLASRKKEVKKARHGKFPEIAIPVFTDPLTKKSFYL